MSPGAPAELIMQNKPNLQDDQMNISALVIRDYENRWYLKRMKNKPNTNPIKPNLLDTQTNIDNLFAYKNLHFPAHNRV
jgi:hypothetical protein